MSKRKERIAEARRNGKAMIENGKRLAREFPELSGPERDLAKQQLRLEGLATIRGELLAQQMLCPRCGKKLRLKVGQVQSTGAQARDDENFICMRCNFSASVAATTLHYAGLVHAWPRLSRVLIVPSEQPPLPDRLATTLRKLALGGALGDVRAIEHLISKAVATNATPNQLQDWIESANPTFGGLVRFIPRNATDLTAYLALLVAILALIKSFYDEKSPTTVYNIVNQDNSTLATKPVTPALKKTVKKKVTKKVLILKRIPNEKLPAAPSQPDPEDAGP